jgi:hypothetical protein
MKVHGVVHVLDLERLERVRGRIDVTRDEPHRHANATRSVRQPDHGAMLSGERVERGAHFLSARKGKSTGLHLPFEGLTVELKVPSLGTFQRSPRETRDSVRKVTEIAEDWYHARAQASRRCSRDTPLNTESFARKGRSCSPSCSRTLPCACACARVRWIQAVAGMGEAWASVT